MFQPDNIALVVKRIAAEYRELPGLRLTERQVQRMWDLDRATCATVIDTLVLAQIVMKSDGEIVAVQSRPKYRT